VEAPATKGKALEGSNPSGGVPFDRRGNAPPVRMFVRRVPPRAPVRPCARVVPNEQKYWELWRVASASPTPPYFSSANQTETDPELKGRWTEPPAPKRRFFGELESTRNGDWRCLSVASGCVRADSTNKKLFFVGLVFCR